MATGNDEAEVDEAATQMRRQVAFYGSTPAYTAVLDHHGHGGLHASCTARAGASGSRWAMPSTTTCSRRTACGSRPTASPGRSCAAYRGLADRVSFYYLGAARIDWKPIVAELQAAGR